MHSPFSQSSPLYFSSFFYSFKVVSPPLNEVLLTRKVKASSSVKGLCNNYVEGGGGGGVGGRVWEMGEICPKTKSCPTCH